MSEEFVRAVNQKEFHVNAEGYYRSLSTSASHIIQPVYRQTAGVTNLMSADDIVPLVKKTIPTVVGFDPGSQSHTIGDEARGIGRNRKTTVFNFKPVFGVASYFASQK
jgi:molecular chaperone DnaK (HSP70)